MNLKLKYVMDIHLLTDVTMWNSFHHHRHKLNTYYHYEKAVSTVTIKHYDSLTMQLCNNTTMI